MKNIQVGKLGPPKAVQASAKKLFRAPQQGRTGYNSLHKICIYVPPFLPPKNKYALPGTQLKHGMGK